MLENIKNTLVGYLKFRGGRGHLAFLLHRISGLATIVFLTFHILTTSTVFFAPRWYDILVGIFRNPLIMAVEIVLAFFVVYHGVNGLRIAYVDLFRPGLLAKEPTRKSMTTVFIVSICLWLPAFGIMGYALLNHGLGFLAAP